MCGDDTTDDSSKSTQVIWVLRHTEFFIAIACAGDYNVKTTTSSYLSWIEECFLL